MELQRYIGRELSSLRLAIDRVLDSLTYQEISWQPVSGCNSIGLILFHVARSEDGMIQGTIQGTAQIWTSEKWYEKLNLSVEEEGSHYTVEQVNAFQVPQRNDIRAYHEAVRDRTKKYLRGMELEEFDKNVTFPNFGELPTATIFSIIVTHTAEHIGEMAYLRGLQRGMDK